MSEQLPAPTFAIVGAGPGGICMAYNIRREFPNAQISIFEQEDGPGGTWHNSTFPGAACDVMSHLYQFSFDLNPKWSEAYSPQQEIEEYLKDVVRRHGIDKFIRYSVCFLWLFLNADISTYNISFQC
jgi:cation diffusion facilitator CzcD-associated flavoprotein CzcO